MIKTVRDDVIKLESFVAAAFKYDEELTRIYEVGGYCLVSQLKNKYGETKAKRMIEDMQNYKLISTEYYSNSKFAYITQNGLKYLANKDNTTDNINIRKKNIEKNPPEKVLIASILKYQIEPGYKVVRRSDYIKELEEKILEIKGLRKIMPIETINSSKEKYIKNKVGVVKLIKIIKPYIEDNIDLKSIVKVSEDKYSNKIKQYDELIKYCSDTRAKLDIYTKTAITLFDMSKLIILPEGKDTLLFYIIDYSKIKAISKYFNDVFNFERTIGRIFKDIKIIFLSYKKERFDVFSKRLNNYLRENNLSRKVELIEINQCYYLENTIERTVNTRSEEVEIKSKDKEAYMKIKEQLNSSEIGEN